MFSYTLTKNDYLTSLKDVACMEYIESTDNRTCILRSNVFAETLELGQRNVYISVSKVKHNMMRMKTTDYMWTVDTLLAIKKLV